MLKDFDYEGVSRSISPLCNRTVKKITRSQRSDTKYVYYVSMNNRSMFHLHTYNWPSLALKGILSVTYHLSYT